MTINVHEVATLHAWEEPNGSYGIDHSATFGDFMPIPFCRDADFEVDLDVDLHDPQHARQHVDGYDRKVIGRKRAKAKLALNLATFTTRAGNAVQAVQGPLGLFLKAIMGGETLGTGTTVTGSGSTASTIDCTSAAGIAVGTAIGLINPTTGLMEVREVASISGNTVTVKLAFSFTPSAAAVVYASATYHLGGTLGSQTTSLQMALRRINATDRNLLLGGFLDGTSMKFDLKRGQLGRMTVDLMFANWLEAAVAAGDFSNDGAPTKLTYTNAVPIVEKDSALYQQTAGTATYTAATTRVKAQVIEIVPAVKYTTLDVPGGVENIEQPLRDSNVPVMTGAFVCPWEDTTWRAARDADTIKALFYQLGSIATRGAVCISVPTVQIEKVKRVRQDGIASQRVEWCARNDEYTSPNLTDLALSAFRVHLLQEATVRAERFGVISIFDPAIDTAAVPIQVWQDYNATRRTELLDPYVIPGKSATIYHIREIPKSLWFRYCKGATTDAELQMRCFLAGIEKIEHLEQRDGSYLPEWAPAPQRIQGADVIREDSLDRFNCGDIEEIGEVIRQHSFLRMSIERFCVLPDSLVERWTDYRIRLVAASQSSPASSNATASSGAASTPSDTETTKSPSAPSADG